jgi:excisionase family DNA binding protein
MSDVAAILETALRPIRAELESLRLRRDVINEASDYLSIKGAAEAIDVSATHIRRAVVSRDLPASNVGSEARPTYRISREDLDAWMRRRREGPVTRAAAVPASRHYS